MNLTFIRHVFHARTVWTLEEAFSDFWRLATGIHIATGSVYNTQPTLSMQQIFSNLNLTLFEKVSCHYL